MRRRLTRFDRSRVSSPSLHCGNSRNSASVITSPMIASPRNSSCSLSVPGGLRWLRCSGCIGPIGSGGAPLRASYVNDRCVSASSSSAASAKVWSSLFSSSASVESKPPFLRLVAMRLMYAMYPAPSLPHENAVKPPNPCKTPQPQQTKPNKNLSPLAYLPHATFYNRNIDQISLLLGLS